MSGASAHSPAATEEADKLAPVLDEVGSGSFEPPRLPDTVRRVLELTNREDVRLRELHEALETDSMLAARLIKAARSPVYGRLDVRSLRDALVRLGNGSVRNLVLEITLDGPVFKSRRFGAEVAQVQLHNRAVAHLARIIARAAKVPSEPAFLCGLLHDLGILAILQILDERLQTSPSVAWLQEALRTHHAEGSRRIAQAWGLSETVVDVLASHHHVDLADDKNRPVAACLNLAEAIAERLQAGVPYQLDGVPDSAQNDASMLSLELSLDRIGDIVREGDKVVGLFVRRSRPS
ncbi:MAG: HDOD domain-containing protein [Myxococcota bacterium]